MFALEEFDWSSDLTVFFSDDVSVGAVNHAVTPYSFEWIGAVDTFLGARGVPIFESDAVEPSLEASGVSTIETNLLDAELNLEFLDAVFPPGVTLDDTSGLLVKSATDGFIDPEFDFNLLALVGAQESAGEVASVQSEALSTTIDDSLLADGLQDLLTVSVQFEETMFGGQMMIFEIDDFGL